MAKEPAYWKYLTELRAKATIKELEVQKLLREHGLDYVQDLLKLEVKIKGDLVLLKYNQIEADWRKTALYDCRGIILDKADNWNVVCYPYVKFFNIEEGYCAPIDWNNVIVFDKADGSLITLWNYKGEWRCSTSGTIDADSTCNGGEFTFADLVWQAVTAMYGSKEAFLAKLDPSLNYMFELCTPYNIVVTQHTDSKLLLHGVRDMETWSELHIEDFDLVKVGTHDLRNEADMRATFEKMTWQDEGYIIMDVTNFNRAKCKNPAYVSVHHTKSGVSPYEIVNVIKTNEIDEFCVYFKERTEFILMLKANWDILEARLTDIWIDALKSGNYESQKDYALAVMGSVERDFHGLFFKMKNKRILNIREGLCELDNRFLYKYLQDERA